MYRPFNLRALGACMALLPACSRAPPQPPGLLQFARAAATVAADSGFLTLEVRREGGAGGAAQVDFATADGSAHGGVDYTAVTGTLTWGDGESNDKLLTVPIASRDAAEPRTFTVTLSHAKGAALRAPDGVAVTIRSGAPLPLAVGVGGPYLRDAEGNILQLRGVNISGLEGYAAGGWGWNDDHTAFNPWNHDQPSFAAIRTWHANAVRLPLNEASWLDLTIYTHDGKPRPADPGGNYRQVVQATVQEAIAAGFYVILDLHWNGPDVRVPGQAAAVPMVPFEGNGAQNPMADADHSFDFWKSVAATFKDQPAVMFELFNEPYFTWKKRRFSWNSSWLLEGSDEWAAWLHGAVLTHYRNGVNDAAPTEYAWRSAGMQELLDAVRSTGAANVVLLGGIDWAGNLDGWLSHRPRDPLDRTVAVWHAYSDPKHPRLPAYGAQQFDHIRRILKAGIPVMITETGDPNAPGTQGSPFVSTVLPFADAHGISYLGWTWDAWTTPANQLIKDVNGTPTDGYGRYFKDHLACVAAGTAACR